MLTVIVAGTLSVALAAGSAVAQGPGQGRGRGAGGGFCGGRGGGGCMGLTPGAGVGGWWTRVVPTTPAQKAFVAQVTNLHSQIRQANLDLVALRAAKAPAAQIAAKQQQITALRSELQRVTSANQTLLKQMGVPAGVCDGTGPKGRGQGMGRGLRNGTGPNPNCPIR
jgi:hypothetical protein